jgi:phytanoyl-CoA hydroxylase
MAIDEDVAFYREHGYLLCPGVLDADEVDELRAAVGAILADVAGTGDDENHAWRTAEGEPRELVLKGFHNLQYHDAAFTRAVAHPGWSPC